MKSQLARSVFWIVWSRVALQMVSFVSTLVVARLLSPADYGLVALAYIWTSGLALVTELGLGSAIIQFPDLDERELNACFWLTLGMAASAYVALFAAAPAIAAWFASPRLSGVLQVLAFTLPLAALRIVPDSLLRKRLALDRVSQAEIASVIVNVPVVLGLAWAGAGVWALVAGALTTQLIQGGVTFAFVGWYPGLRVGGRQLARVIRYSLATLGAKVCWAAYQDADVFILGKISGDVVLGAYAMAKQLAIMPVEKVSVVVNQLASPLMAELQSDRAAIRNSLLRGVRLVAWMTFPVCVGFMLVAEDLVRAVLTDKWVSVVPAVNILCIYAALRSVAVLLPPVLMARYRAAFLFRYNLMLLGVMPLAFWAGAAGFAAVGVATAWVVVYPLVMAWMAREALREVAVSWRQFGAELWPPLATTLLMAAVMLGIQWGVSSLGLLPRLAVTSLGGALTYAAGLLRLGGLIHGEIQEITTWIFRANRSLATTR